MMGNDDLFKIRQSGRKVKKREAREVRSRQWLIVCEGAKTEPNYFNGLLEHLINLGGKDLFPFVRIKGLGRNTESLVRSAESFFDIVETEYGRMRIPYGNLAMVFDRDSFGKDSFNNAIFLGEQQKHKYPDIEQYISAWSNESFELWIYLHFHYTDSALSRHDLNAKLTEIFRAGGVLSDRKSYAGDMKMRESLFTDIINCGGSIASAIRNAERLSQAQRGDKKYADQNPHTEVGILVKALAEEAGVELG